ncbi:patatin-like phospholipase family protein [Marinicellulosiphila megalodicopiae]|uniref:patatin-like phospholipase family protein n=1 Tax=Marinicellulosiphila megalodicopiae TaxID=2724896 RepID=UPI003BAE516F
MDTNNHQKKRKISLVLGSGGARGLTHIGVIRWLEENDFEINSISGCSIGALVGGIYANGKLAEFEKWVCAISKMDIVKFMDLSWQNNGLIKGDKIIQSLIDLVGNPNIEELPIKFTAVASDIDAEKEVWLSKGLLFDAIRASISIPLFFTPYQINGVDLIDGGVLNPLPVAPTFADGNELIIAVDLVAPIDKTLHQPKENETKTDSGFSQKIGQFITNISKSPVEKAFNLTSYEIATQCIDSMQSVITREKMASNPADYVVKIPRNISSILDFHLADELIKFGYEQAEKTLGHLKLDKN